MSGPGTAGRLAGRRRSCRVLARVVLGAGLALLPVAVSACGSGGVDIGSRSVTACYRAIPVARAAVKDPTARLLGVHSMVARHLHAAVLTRLTTALPPNDPLCVVALGGPFGVGQVGVASGAAGRYAVVVVTSRRLEVVGVLVTDHLPRRFGGRVFP
jgi:hypothetical protein